MEEMRAMIEQRRGGPVTPRPVRPRSVVEGSLSSSMASSLDDADTQNLSKAIDAAVSDAENNINEAVANYSRVEDGISRLVSAYQAVSYVPLQRIKSHSIPLKRVKELTRTFLELKRSKRQGELLKELLSSATAENEILYGVSFFNS